MTPTATNTKTDGLQKVAEAEAAWVAAKDADRAAGREHSELLRRYQELEEQRRKLVYANPELVDHLGAPVGESNPIGKLDQEREALPDLDESAARTQHTRNIERSKRQAYEAQIANNAEAVREQERTKDDALQRDYVETMTKAAEIAKARVNVRLRLTEVAHICRDNTRVAIDAVADAERTVRRLAEQPPATAREA